MKSTLLFSLAMVFLTILTIPASAGRMPDYHCGEQASRCEKACDEMAEQSKNANAYQRCLDRCQEQSQQCEERREGYRQCKDK
jgi:hypothetical protein